MIRALLAALCLWLVALAASASTIAPFAFDDQANFAAPLPKSTGGATRDVILGVHGSVEPNDGVRLDDAIRGIAGSAEPNDGITARALGTYGLLNGFDTYVGLAPVTVVDKFSGPQDWLFGVLYTGSAATYILAKSGANGLSEITEFTEATDPALLAALTPLGFGSDDIRNVDAAQNGFVVAPVPLPASGVILATAVLGMAAFRRRRVSAPVRDQSRIRLPGSS